jgi:tripartite ATP-independent transporter DctP family solute receptor
MNSKTLSFFFVGILVGIVAASAAYSWMLRSSTTTSTTVQILKLAHTLDPKHPVHQAMEFMAERLREKSGGTVELQIFPNSQLGSETECIELVQQGALAITKTSAAPLEGFVPELALFGVPYVFRNEEHYWKLIHSDLGKQLLAAGEAKGIRGLCYYDAGARSFYTVDRPILKPSDLSGLKIRVQQSKTAMDMVQSLGGSPTPVPFGELYTALQSSMVDGAENNTPSFYSNRHYEVCKHYSLDEHTRVPDLLLVSTKVWNELSPQVQIWLQQAADESSEYQRKLWQEETARLLELIRKEGVEIHYPDQSQFAEQVKSMHESFSGTRVGDLMKQLSEM